MLGKLKEGSLQSEYGSAEIRACNFTWGNVSGIDREKRSFVIKTRVVLSTTS